MIYSVLWDSVVFLRTEKDKSLPIHRYKSDNESVRISLNEF